jgi:hypothetical protein
MVAVVTNAPAPGVALAQPREGQIIQGPDGSLYVYEGGELHWIEPVPLSVPEMLVIPLGADVTTGVRIIADPGPPAAAPSVPPAADPAPLQPVGLRIEVIETQRPFPRSANPGTGQEWVRIRLRIHAPANESISTGQWYENMRIQLANGSTVNPPPDAIIISTSSVPDIMKSTSVPAGSTLEGNTVFSVPVGQPVTRVMWTQRGQTVETPIP